MTRLFSTLIPFLLLLSCSEDPALVTNGPTCDADNDEQFTFKVFRFSGQSDSVTFAVTAIVCLSDDDNSQCKVECGDCSGSGRRKRRSVNVKKALETKYYLKAGPYKFGNVDKNQKGLRLF